MNTIMPKLRFDYLLFLAIPLFFQSCLAAKMTEALAMHQKTISETAISRMPTSRKLDVVSKTYVQVLEEALRFSSAKKAIKHVNTFSQQNEKDLDTLFKEIGSWTGNLSTGEKLLFAGKMASQPHTRQLIQLIPKFKRKVNRRIQTFLFLSKLMKVVSPSSLLDNVLQ